MGVFFTTYGGVMRLQVDQNIEADVPKFFLNLSIPKTAKDLLNSNPSFILTETRFPKL